VPKSVLVFFFVVLLAPTASGRAGEADAPGLWERTAPEVFFADDFERENEGSLGSWKVRSGSWRIEKVEDPLMARNGDPARACRLAGKSRGGDAGPALIAAGFKSWDEYRLRVALRLGRAEAAGLAFGVDGSGPAGVLLLTRDGSVLLDGREVGRAGFRPENWTGLELRASRGWISLRINGRTVWSGRVGGDEGRTVGKIAFAVRGGEEAIFDDVSVEGAALVAEPPLGPAPERSGDGPVLRRIKSPDLLADVAAEIELPAGARPGEGLALRVAGPGRYYFFGVGEDGRLVIEKVSDGERTVLAAGAERFPAEGVRLRASAVGAGLRAEIEDNRGPLLAAAGEYRAGFAGLLVRKNADAGLLLDLSPTDGRDVTNWKAGGWARLFAVDFSAGDLSGVNKKEAVRQLRGLFRGAIGSWSIAGKGRSARFVARPPAADEGDEAAPAVGADAIKARDLEKSAVVEGVGFRGGSLRVGPG